jgi:hypothetical protein
MPCRPKFGGGRNQEAVPQMPNTTANKRKFFIQSNNLITPHHELICTRKGRGAQAQGRDCHSVIRFISQGENEGTELH